MRVAIVGATGAVGAELLAVLERRQLPLDELIPLASARSAGTKVRFRGRPTPVRLATAAAFEGVDIAFFSAGAARSRELGPAAMDAGARVIDNSSAFRLDPDVPLIVPEVNGDKLPKDARLIANPNCVAAILTVALAPLARLAPISRLVIATYQSASGAGARAMDDLLTQTRAALAGEPVVPEVLLHPYAFNLFSHDSAVEDNGYNGEENKVVAETRKILDLPELPISVTCVRVPVLRAHTMAVNIEFGEVVDEEAVRAAIRDAPGARLVDDRSANHFPMPWDASGHDDVLVGRIRRDPSRRGAIDLMVSGDQLLKGAALNAVQIAELL